MQDSGEEKIGCAPKTPSCGSSETLHIYSLPIYCPTEGVFITHPRMIASPPGHDMHIDANNQEFDNGPNSHRLP